MSIAWFLTDFTMGQVEGRLGDLEAENATLRSEIELHWKPSASLTQAIIERQEARLALAARLISLYQYGELLEAERKERERLADEWRRGL